MPLSRSVGSGVEVGGGLNGDVVIEELSRTIYKDCINEWRNPEDDNGENTEERCRACNISVRPSTLDRIDRLWELGYVEYDSRSAFLRDVILRQVAEIESENDIQGGEGL